MGKQRVGGLGVVLEQRAEFVRCMGQFRNRRASEGPAGAAQSGRRTGTASLGRAAATEGGTVAWPTVTSEAGLAPTDG